MYQSDNYLEISRQALVRNAAALTQAVQVPVIGVVKCNGYGITVEEAAKAWQSAGVTVFAVSRPQEAAALRQAGFREDILLLSPVADGDTLEEMAALGVILTVTGFENALLYRQWSSHFPLRVHVAVDTGMGRFGVRWTAREELEAIYRLEGFAFEGIFSHFAKAFEKDYCLTRRQLERFLEVTEYLAHRGIYPGMRHIANSCAALRFPQTRLDGVRLGSALVGKLPVVVPVALEPVGRCRAQVVDLHTLSPGDTTGYGAFCRIHQPMRAAVVALGQTEGFGLMKPQSGLRLRDLASHTLQLLRNRRQLPAVCCRGQQLPLVGRIGNQYTLFDATGTDVAPGDYVTWQGDLMLSNTQRRFV